MKRILKNLTFILIAFGIVFVKIENCRKIKKIYEFYGKIPFQRKNHLFLHIFSDYFKFSLMSVTIFKV